MEKRLTNNDGELTAKKYPTQSFIRYKTENTKGNEKKILLQAATELTNRLTQTVPGLYQIVQAVDGNLAHFLFIMHFALCCLHRQSHLRQEVESRT